MRPFRRPCVPVSLLSVVLVACSPGEPAGEGRRATGLDVPDRTLALQPDPVYRVGGFDAPDWALFGSVSAARFDDEGNLYVLDSQANRVTVVSPEGEFLRTVGKSGEGPGELSSPFGFVVLPDGGVAIFDLGHRGFLVYDPAGEHVRTVTVDLEGVGLPSPDMSYHPSGGVVSGLGGRFRMSSDGEPEAGPPTRPIVFYPLAGDGEARVVYEAWDLPEVTDEQTQDLSISGGGSFSIRMPLQRAFEPDLSVGVLSDGRIVVADSVGYRIKLVDLEGRVAQTLERPVAPTEVTDAIERQEKERRLAAMQEGGGPRMVLSVRGADGGGGQVDPEAVRRMQEQRLEAMVFAAEIPVIEALAADPGGRIWVQRSSGVPGEDGPTDILTADGGYLGSIPADGLRIPEAFGPDGLIVHIETDDLDVPTLVVSRLPDAGGTSTDED